MKASKYIICLKEWYPTAEVEVVRRGRRHDWIIVVTAVKGEEWEKFLYPIGSEGEEIGEQRWAYERAIEGWYNKNEQ